MKQNDIDLIKLMEEWQDLPDTKEPDCDWLYS